jgi:outer membrane protein assembly factor BamA
MHLGRYLRDSEDESLSQLFLGYDTYIRGYNSYSFDLSECADDDNNCPEFQRLIGSRIGVLNLELRLPILGNSQFGLINFPYIPTDIVAFFDGGVSWTKNSRPSLKLATKNKERVPVFSAGGAARVNLFNLLVLQIYAAYPFQRTDKEWVWGLFFAPGW